MTDDVITGERFKALLKRAGLSQYVAARWLNLSRRQVNRVATGQYAAPVVVVKLLRVMVRHRLTADDVDSA